MAAGNSAQDIDVDLGTLFASLRRGWRTIAGVAIAATLAALLFAALATPHYRGETRLLIETRESVFTRPANSNQDERPILDEEGVTSQVEVISSTDLLKQVAAELDLAQRPEFSSNAGPSLLTRVLMTVGLKSDSAADVPPEESVLDTFREKLQIYRVEKSRVIVIQFSSEDPQLAAAVPNAIADAYIALQRESKKQSNAAATEWLEPEIAELRERVKNAEAHVAEFRAQSDLLIGQNNSVLATQQLSELSSELSRVRASRAAAEANAQSLRAALAAGASVESIPEVLSSGLIQRLRERQIQLQADIADLSTTLLDNHPRMRALRSQLRDLGGQIRDEAAKVLEGLETETQTAQFRERQLLADLNTLKAASARAGEEQVELRALEREAAAQRELLESYLTRYREAASRREGNYLPADARVFSRAIVPSESYYPKVVPVAAVALLGSLLIMVIVTLLRELFSGRAMRPANLSEFGPVQQVAMAASVAEPERGDVSNAAARPAPEAVRLGQWTIEGAAEKLISRGAARAIFVSPEGDEAAATSILVAREVSDAGLRTLLLDLTSTGAASRPMLDGLALPGITNLLASEAQFTDVIHGDHYSECHVIPVGTADPERAMRAADRLPIIMQSLTTAYDVVVVECGPADAEGIRRLVGPETEVLVSVIEPDDAAIAETAAGLEAGGYSELTMVTPAGYKPPVAPVPDRTAA
jgi:exopolysaccharide transport family protein